MIYKYWIIIISISLLSIGNSMAQEDSNSKDSLVVELPFALTEIPTEFTKLSNSLIEISKIIEVQERIINLDSTVSTFAVTVQQSKEEIMLSLPTMTYQRLESLIRAWHNYKNKFDIIQETLKTRIEEIEIVKVGLEEELQKWNIISDATQQMDLPEEFKQGIDNGKVNLSLMIENVINRSDTLLIVQSRQIELNLLIDEIIRILEEEQKIFQSNYFIVDSNPIWNASDSTSQFPNIRIHFNSEFTNSYQNLKVYLKSNKAKVFLQIIFIILLIIGFAVLRRVWPTGKLDSNSKRETQAGIVIKHPILSSLLISITISAFFYTNRPLLLGGLFVMIMMFSSLMLLPGLILNKIRYPLLLLLILFIANFLQDFLPYQSSLNRIIIIIQSLATLFLLFVANRLKDEFNLRTRGVRIFTGFLRIFGLLMIMAFIANIIGSVKLADFLISSTIRTLTFSVIVIAIVIILNCMMILLIKGKKAESIPLYEQLKKLIDKRIRPMINWGGLILWFFAALIYFRLLKPAQDLVDQIMDIEFMISTVAISIGGIISLILIVLFTYLIVRFVKSIFKDELITNSGLPRGTADALSMLIRYIIVAFGIYLALAAIGVSMSKFGFMAGALGVGIGFGLQNVVLNFIAGLILSFEKPIHVGDVIEVDQYMGKVTEIGVRASKVLTWDGSEVIVPNGLLISNKVVNWTLDNQKRRLTISIKTPFDADPEKVIEILTDVAGKHPNTLNHPEPMTLFNGYESSSLDFTVYCWVDFSEGLRTKSDLAINAKKALTDAGIAAPIPYQKLKIENGNISD